MALACLLLDRDVINSMGFLLFLSGSYIVEFEKFPYCFPQWLHQFAFLPKVYKDLLFSRSSPAFVICVLFDDSHSDRFFFPSWLVVLSIFSYTCCPPAFPLWKRGNVYSVFLPSFKQFVFCDVELYELFLYFVYYFLINYRICKYFFPFNELSFHFFDNFLCCAIAFRFN